MANFLDSTTQTVTAEALIDSSICTTAKKISDEVIDYMLSIKHGIPVEKSSSKEVETMRRIVSEILVRYSPTFKGFANGLTVNSSETQRSFEKVVQEIFADNEINWGRIATLYAYGTKMALEAERDSQYVDGIKTYIAEYTGKKLGNWISEHGGWVRPVVYAVFVEFYNGLPLQEGFVNFFEDGHTALEDSLKRAATWTAVGLGIAGFATMAILAVK